MPTARLEETRAMPDTSASLPKCLSAHVADSLDDYFNQLDGHPPPADLYDLVIRQVEAPLLRKVLGHCGGNQSRTAEILGLNRATLRKKLRQHGIVAHLA